MRILIFAFIIIVNFILQTTVFSYIEIIGVKPNTSLLIIVIYSMLRGDVEGSIVGFATGLLHDIFFGKVIGIYALLGFLTGFICGKPFKNFYRENFMLPLLLTGVACVCYEIVFYLVYFLFRGEIDIFFYLGRIILPEAVYTMVISIPVYRLIYAVNNKLEAHENYSRKLF